MQRDYLNRRLKGKATKQACSTPKSLKSVENGHETKLWLNSFGTKKNLNEHYTWTSRGNINDKKMHDMTPLN